MLDVATAGLGTQSGPELCDPNGWKPPKVEAVCVSPTHRGRRTSRACAPLSALGAPAHFTLTIHFPDTERHHRPLHSFSYSHLPRASQEAAPLFPSSGSFGLFLPLSLSPSLFFPSSRTRLVISNKS